MTELSVAFIDDNEKHLLKSQMLFGEIIKRNFPDLKLKINTFISPESFLASTIVFNILFLDYEMKEMNGLEVAEIYMNRHPMVAIFFYSGYKELTDPMQHSSNYNLSKAFFFKSDPVEKIEPIIVRVLTEMFQLQIIEIPHYIKYKDFETKKIKKKLVTTTVNAYSIELIEVERKLIRIFVDTIDYHTNVPLVNWLNILPANHFARINKSTIINLKYVDTYSKDYVYLTTGVEIKLSATYFDDFKSLHHLYLFHQFKKY